MRVFILGTGRCGTMTVARACSNFENFTAAHESRVAMMGEDRFDYADWHVEADNRLSWFLGELDRRFGDDAFYVHLRRDREATAQSLMRRWPRRHALVGRLRRPTRSGQIIDAFSHFVLMHPREWARSDRIGLCRFYVDTVTSNVELFLRGKSKTLVMELERVAEQFPEFMEAIGARGDLSVIQSTLAIDHNSRVQWVRRRR